MPAFHVETPSLGAKENQCSTISTALSTPKSCTAISFPLLFCNTYERIQNNPKILSAKSANGRTGSRAGRNTKCSGDPLPSPGNVMDSAEAGTGGSGACRRA